MGSAVTASHRPNVCTIIIFECGQTCFLYFSLLTQAPARRRALLLVVFKLLWTLCFATSFQAFEAAFRSLFHFALFQHLGTFIVPNTGNNRFNANN